MSSYLDSYGDRCSHLINIMSYQIHDNYQNMGEKKKINLILGNMGINKKYLFV